MRSLTSRHKATNWFRFFMKLGLLATDAAVWASMHNLLSEREDVTRRVRETVSSNLAPRRGRSHVSTLLTGMAIGVGVGMLFAPVSGEEARSVVRDKASAVKDKWDDVAAWAGLGSPEMRRSTGTYAD
ncbi:MAG TPA: YtxH domain-containing protein [Candidatus Sulfotelmatobacter sp.]|nr:YtxH domain-containing protein [Candidatus Sulfotelmatobacter sp.]